MDSAYDIMSAVDEYCNTKIDDFIADIPNDIVNSDILNDSQEMAQFLGIGGKKTKTLGKRKKTKVSEDILTTTKQLNSKSSSALEKQSIIKRPCTIENQLASKSISTTVKSKTQSKSKTSKPRTKNLHRNQSQAGIPSDEDIDSNLEIDSTQFQNNAQRGKARRRYMSDFASRVPTLDSLDLTAQNSSEQNSIPTARSKRLANRLKNVHEQNASQPNNGIQRTANSNIICIGSDDEDAGVTYQPINIAESSSALNKSYSNLDIENPEYSVKIEWLNKIESFPLRKYQKFNDVFEILAKRENANVKDIMLNLDNKIIEPNDSPASINYLLIDTICGRIVKNNIPATKMPAKMRKDNNQVCIKLQSNFWKRHISITIKKTDSFNILYIKCSEELKLPFEKFSLLFDGDNLAINQTPNDLNFEDGEIIDCVVKK